MRIFITPPPNWPRSSWLWAGLPIKPGCRACRVCLAMAAHPPPIHRRPTAPRVRLSTWLASRPCLTAKTRRFKLQPSQPRSPLAIHPSHLTQSRHGPTLPAARKHLISIPFQSRFATRMANKFRVFDQNRQISAMPIATGENNCRAIVENFPACGKPRVGAHLTVGPPPVKWCRLIRFFFSTKAMQGNRRQGRVARLGYNDPGEPNA